MFTESHLTRSGGLSPEHRAALADAMVKLEHRGFAIRLSQALGRQIDRVGKLVPVEVSGVIDHAADAAIKAALNTALRTLSLRSAGERRLLHKAVATLSGAIGGAFGLASLPVELPFSTIVMLRAIAAIAQAEGEDLETPDAALACLQVFALGAGGQDQPFESGYFAVRSILAKSVSEAARFIVERGIAEESAPVILRLVSQIATRFGVVVSQKIAAQSVPLLGAAGGGAVNFAFIDHFQTIAQGHFAVRRLERLYGADLVKAEYDRLLKERAAAS